MESFDFIVIGAGIAGASIAAELTRRHRVALVEQEDVPGYHATGRSAALYSEIYGNAAIRALTRASHDFLVARQDDGSSFATPRGSMFIATEAQRARLESFGALPDVCNAVEFMSAAEARARVPVLRPDYIAAALFERQAYDLEVHGIHQHYLRTAKRNGAHIYYATPALHFERAGCEWFIDVADGRLAGQVLVNAAGAWADRVAIAAGGQPVGLQALRRTALLVSPPERTMIDDWPLVIDIDEQFYFKPDAGKILMSPADETPTDPCDAYVDDIDVAIAVDRIQAAADIPVLHVSHSWAGLRTFAPDKSPVVGYDPQLPGFFWLAGQGGYGIQTAPALAALAARLATGNTCSTELVPDLDLRDLSVERFRCQAPDR